MFLKKCWRAKIVGGKTPNTSQFLVCCWEMKIVFHPETVKRTIAVSMRLISYEFVFFLSPLSLSLRCGICGFWRGWGGQPVSHSVSPAKWLWGGGPGEYRPIGQWRAQQQDAPVGHQAAVCPESAGLTQRQGQEVRDERETDALETLLQRPTEIACMSIYWCDWWLRQIHTHFKTRSFEIPLLKVTEISSSSQNNEQLGIFIHDTKHFYLTFI